MKLGILLDFKNSSKVNFILIKMAASGKMAGDIFFYGWLVWTFFKLYGSLVAIPVNKILEEISEFLNLLFQVHSKK